MFSLAFQNFKSLKVDSTRRCTKEFRVIKKIVYVPTYSGLLEFFQQCLPLIETFVEYNLPQMLGIQFGVLCWLHSTWEFWVCVCVFSMSSPILRTSGHHSLRSIKHTNTRQHFYHTKFLEKFYFNLFRNRQDKKT